jgi:translation elongation factor EF-1alpha
MLAKALGVQSLIAVVTKMGLVNWSETRYKQIK